MRNKLTVSEKNALRREAEALHDADREYRRASNFDFFALLLLVVIMAFAVRDFIIEPFRVDGISMFPTLIHNERMAVEKLSYTFREPKQGEIIVCYYPGYKESCVKRVIALPGDTIAVMDGAIYVNGILLDESAYWDDTIYGGIPPHIVPEDHVFVVGDNRNNSSDSRNPDIGDIPFYKIEGRVVFVVWPFATMRPL